MSVDQIEDDHAAEMVLPASIAAHLAKPAYDGAQIARDALSAALAQESEINQARATLQAQIDAARQATALRDAAEAAWAAFVIEDGLSAKPDNAKRAELRAAVLAARDAMKPLADDQAKLTALQTAALEVNRRIVQHQRDVILAEAVGLAQSYHHHEAQALKARAAIEGLARAALVTAEAHRDLRSPHEMKPGEMLNHSAAAPFTALANTIRQTLNYGADPVTSAAEREARIDAAEAYGREVGSWVAALNADPFARVPGLDD